QGEPLVLLHGLGSSWRDWQYQWETLGEHFQLILPDMRGFGKSSKPPGPYKVDQYAQDLMALLDHLNIQQTHLLGYSMGGAAAFQFAVDNPDRLNRLIIVNSTPDFSLDHWRKRLELKVRQTVIRMLGVPTLAQLIAKRLFPDPGQEELRAMTIERYGANEKHAYLSALDGLAGWSIIDRIDQLVLPTLVLAAEHDYTPFAEKEAYVARMPNAQLVQIKDSRHGTPMDQPQVFNDLVLSFLRSEDSQEEAVS
ncbi:MAG TPA: 3-oxoadipate enol-lactonase, partial [Deltaproteobacteria bacterium]|nr:3-oxoadipate enol-lactonase [Deltaproteobacteria bacterium]